MDTVISILIFLIMFTVVVASHEFGHFLLAKLNGITVLEFSIGMGPTLLHFTKGGTKYSLKLLPIGGACIFEGENGLEKDEDGKVKEIPEGSFMKAGVWKRIATVVAGPLFNILLAFVFSLIIVAFCGSDKPVIQDTMEGYPAEEAGILAGDTLTKINKENIHIYRQVSLISALNKGQSLDVEYIRDGKEYKTTITPKYDEETGRYYIGILGAGELIECKGADLFKYAYYEVNYWFGYTFKALRMLVGGELTKDDVAGPVGMTQQIEETYEAVKPYGFSSVLFTMMSFATLISVNLGILNLLPIPALDGGRLLFMLIEVVRGKPIPPEKEGIVHLIGMAALFAFMIFVLFNDIMRFF